MKFIKRCIGIILILILFAIWLNFIHPYFNKTTIDSKVKYFVDTTWSLDDETIEFEEIRKLEGHVWAKSVNEGYYKPANEHPNHSFAIVIPNRSRAKHLKIFLDYMHPYLQLQNAEYQIFVIEQANNRSFNKATLMNVGFILANLHSKVPFNCIIFHDIDVLPIEPNVIYRCSKYPYHLGAWVNVFNFRIAWDIVGAVFAVTQDQFRQVNGFSNIYEGWGAEDTDMHKRVMHVFQKLDRPPKNQRYRMIKHERDIRNPMHIRRFWYLDRTLLRYKNDGLNSTTYNLVGKRSKFTLVNWFCVDFPPVDYYEYNDFKKN